MLVALFENRVDCGSGLDAGLNLHGFSPRSVALFENRVDCGSGLDAGFDFHELSFSRRSAGVYSRIALTAGPALMLVITFIACLQNSRFVRTTQK